MDLGSEKANNMTYTESADIYLADMSSQALEFSLLKRRPCIFINSQNISDEDVPISWGMGKVYDNISSKTLDSVLNDAESLFVEKYSKEQDKIINQTFTIPKNITSSTEAAKVIYNYAQTL